MNSSDYKKRGSGFAVFTAALEYMEDNLCEDFTQDEVAAACCCSLSSLQKIWRYSTHTSIKEYVTKRRLTLAGRDLLSTNMTVLDIAVKYGYNSHETFTRAFTKVWGMSPTSFKINWNGNCGLYPKLNPQYIEGVELNMKKFDITELFDYMHDRIGTYVLCFDIRGLHAVNCEIGRDAGDKMILESLKRITDVCTEDMIAMRIGGDEFVIVTGLSDADEVEKLGRSVLEHNGEKIKYPGGELPLSLTAGAFKICRPLKYSGLCSDFKIVTDKAKSTGKLEFA
ncbi:MAG: helix-turn-helix domain-containing protein [Ruminococcus sp.]|nr:helix-turn-helix domain-containing protein [Ruminococcus sp.]